MLRPRPDRAGYVTLLAISFAFGLATLGTTVAVASRSYISSARRAENVLLTRMALETAVWERLGRLSGGEAFGGGGPEDAGDVVVELSSPAEKWDPNMDSIETIVAALGQTDPLIRFLNAEGGLADRSRTASLSGAQEDCLRRQVTLGRAPQEKSELSEASEAVALAAGDQIDVRASGPGDRVLWVRARFLGHGLGWVLHDYRLLHTQNGDICGTRSVS